MEAHEPAVQEYCGFHLFSTKMNNFANILFTGVYLLLILEYFIFQPIMVHQSFSLEHLHRNSKPPKRLFHPLLLGTGRDLAEKRERLDKAAVGALRRLVWVKPSKVRPMQIPCLVVGMLFCEG